MMKFKCAAKIHNSGNDAYFWCSSGLSAESLCIHDCDKWFNVELKEEAEIDVRCFILNLYNGLEADATLSLKLCLITLITDERVIRANRMR